MRNRRKGYAGYSIACFVVWAILLVALAATGSPKFETVLIVFLGWTIGWLSATIARYVYPPPKRDAHL